MRKVDLSHKRYGNTRLVEAVRALGFSEAKARRAVRAVFAALTRGLADGRSVEIGGLRLQVKTRRKLQRQYLYKPGLLKHQPPLQPRLLRTKNRNYISQEVLLGWTDE